MKMLAVLFSLVFVGSALAQSGTAGNPNFDRANDWRSGKPNVLTIDSEDVAFDGSPVEVSFTLNGGPAEVHLAVYSRTPIPSTMARLLAKVAWAIPCCAPPGSTP